MLSEDKEIQQEIQAQISIRENQISEIEKEILKKVADDKRDLGSNFDQKIVDLESKLNSEKIKLKAISEELTELTGKNNELTKVINGLGNDFKDLSIEKYSTINKKWKEFVSGELSKKKASVENEIEREFKTKLAPIESKLTNEEAKFNDASEKHAEAIAIKNEIKNNVNGLEKELKNIHKEKTSALKLKLKEAGPIEDPNKKASLEKEIENNFKPKISEIESKLISEKSKLDNVSKSIEEWTATKNELNSNITGLKNELKPVSKEKTVALKLKLKEIEAFEDPNKKASIEREINDEFKPKINEINSQLNSGKSELDNISKKVEELTARKNELNKNIKYLESDVKMHSKGKDSAFKSIMKDYTKEKKPQIKQLNKEILRFKKELKILEQAKKKGW